MPAIRPATGQHESTPPPSRRGATPTASNSRPAAGRPYPNTRRSGRPQNVDPGSDASTAHPDTQDSNLLIGGDHPSFHHSTHTYGAQSADAANQMPQGLFGPGSRTIISGSTPVFHAHTHHHTEQHMGLIQILYQRSSPAAGHNSLERYDPPKCHENTRVELLEMIQEWANDGQPRIMWLYGTAGSGKSAVAQTTCDRLKKGKSNLAASFFFSRTAAPTSQRGHERCFVTTLCYQLTESIPGLSRYVEDDIRARPSVFDLTLNEQVLALIIGPLSELKRNSGNYSSLGPLPRIIIVDGLDECKEERGQTQVLDAIATLVAHQDIFPFSVFVASRPELTIRSWFDNTHSTAPLLAQSVSLLDSCDNDHDIEVYVKAEGAKIRKTHPLKHQIPPRWPSSKIIKEIVYRAAGQFVFARTVIEYARYQRDDPARRLENLLENTVPDSHRPYAELDALYLHILRQTEHPAHVHQMLAFRIITVSFLGYRDINERYDNDDERNVWDCDDGDDFSYIAGFLEQFLSLPCSADAVLLDLRSIINSNIEDFALDGGDAGRAAHKEQSSSFGDPVPSLFYHASLLDFLLDPLRSKEFYIDTQQFDKAFTEMAIKQIEESNLNPSFNNGDDDDKNQAIIDGVLYRFLIVLQTEASGDPQFTDRVSAQLSRWDNLADTALIRILSLLCDLCISKPSEVVDIIEPKLWKVLFPVLLRERRRCQEGLQKIGMSREIFTMHKDIMPVRAGSDGVFQRSVAWQIINSTQSYAYYAVNDAWAATKLPETWERKLRFYRYTLFGRIIERLDHPPSGAEIEGLDVVKREIISERLSTLLLYIRNIKLLLNPATEAEKPDQIRAYFDGMKRSAGEHWRATLACRYLSRCHGFMWKYCPISTDVILALEDLSAFLFPPHIVSYLENTASSFFPDPESQQRCQALFPRSCALPRWFMEPPDADSTVSRGNAGKANALGYLHDYCRLYRMWNTQLTPADRNSQLSVGVENVSWISAKYLSKKTADPQTGLTISLEEWSLGERTKYGWKEDEESDSDEDSETGSDERMEM